MSASFWLPAIVLAAVLSRVLVRAYTEVDDAFVEEWAQAHGLTLTPANRPMVRWYLHTARVLRTWGAVGGFLLPPLMGAALGSQALEDFLFPLVFVGYLAGALYAEVALVRPVGDRRVAALVPRELAAYLPRRLLLAPRVLGAGAAAVTVLVLLLDYDREARYGTVGSIRVSAVALAAVAVVVAVLLERIETWVVQRPQPFTDPDLVAADDAIRSQSVHSLAGSGLAVQLLCLGGVLFALARSDVQVLRWTIWVPALACMVGAGWVCLYYGHRAWRVRRAVGSRALSP